MTLRSSSLRCLRLGRTRAFICAPLILVSRTATCGWPTVCWVGGWARGSDVPERLYIDPTFMPTPACYMLWGWLLVHAFSVDAGVWVRAAPLPDPLDE